MSNRVKGLIQKRAKGNRAELRSKRLMESKGFEVIRSSGSQSPFDLVCFNALETILLQVRTNAWCKKHEFLRMRQYPTMPGGRKIILRWDDHDGQPHFRDLNNPNHKDWRVTKSKRSRKLPSQQL